MITQTLAIFVDAYRDLNARKMFWVVLLLSAFGVLAFGTLGVSDTHLKFLWMNIPDLGLGPPLVAYRRIFSQVFVGLWLTWAATILALISTASIFPEFIAGGSVDLFLSKPISRLRLFITKYLSGLLFVALQVSVFSLIAFFVMGLRGGIWKPAIFLAIPIVLTFFSYLFGVLVLLGVLTRSTLAALLVTILFWLMIAIIGKSEIEILKWQLINQYTADHYDARIKLDEHRFASTTRPTTAAVSRRQEWARDRDDARRWEGNLRKIQRINYWIKTIVPKTNATIDVIDRWLFSDDELQRAHRVQAENLETTGDAAMDLLLKSSVDAEARVEQLERDRTLTWVIGTSLLFEAACLALAAWIFVRRDY